MISEAQQTVEYWIDRFKKQPVQVAFVMHAIEAAELQFAVALVEKAIVHFQYTCSCGKFTWDEYDPTDSLLHTRCPKCDEFYTWEYKDGDWVMWKDTKEEDTND